MLAAPSNASVLVARALAAADPQGPLAGISFALWKSPDELRAAIVSGRAAAFTLPTNVAANLYNRGLPVRLVDVLAVGHMHVLSVDPAVQRIDDLRGRRVQLYFRNDLPDALLRFVLRRAGLTPGSDVGLDYAGSASEAAQLFLAGRAQTVLLSEPAASAVVLAARAKGIAVRRAFTLQQSWATATGGSGTLPLAGLAVTAALAQTDAARVRALHGALAEAADWVRREPAQAAELAEHRLGFRAAEMRESLQFGDCTVLPAAAARSGLESFLTALAELSPDLIGGRLPAADFYFDA